MKAFVYAGALTLAVLASGAVQAQSTLDAVQKKGFVQCGVNTGLAGFSQPDSRGVWKGIDVDVCRAIAAALWGDASKVRYTPLTAVQACLSASSLAALAQKQLRTSKVGWRSAFKAVSSLIVLLWKAA